MKSRSIQRGFAAIAAIFLVVGLAALAGFLVAFSNTQQLTSAQDVQGSRAYWAARSGLEWGVSRALGASCAASTSLTFGDFTVTVTCSESLPAYSDSGLVPGVAPRIFQLTATARSAGAVGSVGYIERSVSTSLEI